jgi:hypothetical protein
MLALVSGRIILLRPLTENITTLTVRSIGSPQELFPQLAKNVPDSSDRSASSTSLEFLQFSYPEYINTDEKCRQSLAYFPNRVIDIFGFEYKLVDSSSDNAVLGSYATFLHCRRTEGMHIARLAIVL